MTYSKDWCTGFCRTCGTGCAQHLEEAHQLLQKLRVAEEALEFISCEGMDDADFYQEDDIVSGTILMALRARDALRQIRGEEEA